MLLRRLVGVSDGTAITLQACTGAVRADAKNDLTGLDCQSFEHRQRRIYLDHCSPKSPAKDDYPNRPTARR